MVFQKEIILPSFPRGFHLITNYIKKELPPTTGKVNSQIGQIQILHHENK